LPYRNFTNILALDTTFLEFQFKLFHKSPIFIIYSKFILQSIGRLLFQQMFCLKCLLQLHCLPLFTDSQLQKILIYEITVTSRSK